MHIRDIDSFDTFKEIFDKIGTQTKWSWIIGGMTGGNCWGNEADAPVGAEDEPDDDLETFLMEVCPDLTFLQFRKLAKAEIFKYRDRYESEYYGNYTEYREKELDLEVLWKELKALYP